MKNLFRGLLALVVVASLAGCKKKKCCGNEHVAVETQRVTKRISGPIVADTTIAWTDEDLK